jgi:hypothetical protein
VGTNISFEVGAILFLMGNHQKKLCLSLSLNWLDISYYISYLTCSLLLLFHPSAEGVHVCCHPCKRKSKLAPNSQVTAPQHSLNMLHKVASRALLQQNILRGAGLPLALLSWVLYVACWIGGRRCIFSCPLGCPQHEANGHNTYTSQAATFTSNLLGVWCTDAPHMVFHC